MVFYLNFNLWSNSNDYSQEFIWLHWTHGRSQYYSA